MKSLKKAFVVASVALITCVSTPTRSAADTLAYTYPTAPGTNNTVTTPGPVGETDSGNYGPSGFEFTLDQNIDVTQLGYTALSLGGDAPSVTLWSVGAGGALTQIYDTGDILTSVTSEPANNQSAQLSFVSVGTPIALTAGNTYLVTATAYWAATFDSSNLVIPGSAFSSTAFLTGNGPGGSSSFFSGAPYGGWNYTLTNVSTDLTAAPLGAIPVEADFQYTIVSAPEPSSYALLGAGLAVLVVMVRRRSAKISV